MKRSIAKSSIIVKLAIIFVFLSTFGCVTDKIIDNRNIKWGDFKGNPDALSPFYACTLWKVNYYYDEPSFLYDKVEIDLRVWCSLSKESWVKQDKKSEELLKHEQVHFNFARLCASEFEKTVKASSLDRSNYRLYIDSVFKVTLKKYTNIEKEYDKETEHYNNKENQLRWDKKIEEMLKLAR